MTRTIHYCNFCDYKSDRRYDRDKHVSRKHGNDHSTPYQAGSGAVQSVQPDSENEKHSNLQEESIDQLYNNIDQWQKAYDTLKEQYQQVEKVTTCNDGRPSHVSIQLYDKCCNALKAYIFQCKRLRTLLPKKLTEEIVVEKELLARNLQEN